MPLFRRRLPQLNGGAFLTDGGLETTLVFHQGVELPAFAAFPLLAQESGRQRLRDYFAPYLALARRYVAGFVLDTATWRANPAWGAKLGYDRAQLDALNRRAVTEAEVLRRNAPAAPVVINGVIGPRGDGYQAGAQMSAAEAQAYHAGQIDVFADTEADMVSAITMTYPEEAIGIARAARERNMPAAISFTVEIDGRLPNGASLQSAIEQVEREAGEAVAYYMINCAHPTHFEDALAGEGAWLDRIRGVRANASTLSHAELDNATELDPGDPYDLGRRYAGLRQKLKRFSVMGGCCGTDHRHIGAICAACLPAA